MIDLHDIGDGILYVGAIILILIGTGFLMFVAMLPLILYLY